LDSYNYHGWVGLAFRKQISEPKKPEYVQKIVNIFSSDGWTTETNGRTFIFHENFDATIEMKFNDEPPEKEKELGVTKFGIRFESNFHDFWKTGKTHQRLSEKHRRLRDKFSHKITWKKQFFNKINYDLERVDTPKRLKQKRKWY